MQKKNKHKLFIHIGAHKTASTYLQSRVFPDMSIYYSPAVSSELRWYVERLHDQDSDNTGDIDVVLRYINDCDGDVLLSHESLMGHFKNRYKFFRKHVRTLKELFPHAELIFVTRNLKSWQKSVYREAVYSQNETRGFEKAVIDFDFNEAIAYLESQFMTHTISFEVFKENPDLFVNRLENILNAKFFGRHGKPIRQGLTPVQLQVARTANVLGLSKQTKQLIKKVLP